MPEIVEYHGWVVMQCFDESWSDDEWERAREGAQSAVAMLDERDGHAAHVDWPANGGSVIALNGWSEGRDAVLGVISRIAALAPDSYGEIVFFSPGNFGVDAVRNVLRGGALVAL